MAVSKLSIQRAVLLCTLIGSLNLAAPAAYAQTVDTIAPIIELEELVESTADRTQVFTVQIAENVQLRDATLYHRREGQLPYTPAPMQALGDTGFYTVSIDTDPGDLRAIEYYVQARDQQGNRTVSGFAFDPYRRSLLPASSALLDEPPVSTPIPDTEPAIESQNWYERRWVQLALGVVAVGVVASLIDGDDGENSVVVPVTFNLE